jgi:hypothetical protein
MRDLARSCQRVGFDEPCAMHQFDHTLYGGRIFIPGPAAKRRSPAAYDISDSLLLKY